MKIAIATRGSELALWQSEYVKERLLEHYDDLEIELKIFKTTGDKILDKPLAEIGGKGLFTKELEDAMSRGEAHISVNSLKDMPFELPEGFEISAITEREDVRDALLSEKYENIDELPHGAVVGTTSLRRKVQILALRPDLKIKELRGNVNTRIAKLKAGEYDAIILASAGINRLHLEKQVKFVYNIQISEMIPSMGQGALAIETTGDPEIVKLVSVLSDEVATIETGIERQFVGKLQGSCSVPIGVNATVLENDTIITKAVVGSIDGKSLLRDTIIGSTKNWENIGNSLSDRMIGSGALKLLNLN
ncbi:porphobilinogen deaminase [Thiovulum sp. ES]|nr:porphobilinogen deaminase [Thiovulum sp. ES]